MTTTAAEDAAALPPVADPAPSSTEDTTPDCPLCDQPMTPDDSSDTALAYRCDCAD